MVVVEILSQDEPVLTAQNQEETIKKQDQLKGIMGIGGKGISLWGGSSITVTKICEAAENCHGANMWL